MSNLPNESNGKGTQNSGSANELNGKGIQNADAERVQARQKHVKKLFIILLTVGLVIGAVVSVGVIALLQRFGLTDSQPQIDQIEQSQ